MLHTTLGCLHKRNWALRPDRIPYLLVLTSTNQLYSGTGTSLFEWIRYARHRFAFTILIDNDIAGNYLIAKAFCEQNGLGFLASGPAYRTGAADPGVADAQLHVASGAWPIVEIASWANTATNLDVVAALRPETVLVFTPHTQPDWTLQNAHMLSLLNPVLDATLAASDLVCCISPAEVRILKARSPNCRTAYLPHAIDNARFRTGTEPRSPQLLMVADFREHRKRVDLALAAMERLVERNPDVMCIIAGLNSDQVVAPSRLKARLRQRGFVKNEELIELYRTSAVLLLLSDFEAFGLPIAEALACGLPVVTTRTEEVASLFQHLPGCFLVRNTDSEDVDRGIDAALTAAPPSEDIAAATQTAFHPDRTLGRKLQRIEALFAARADHGTAHRCTARFSAH